MQLLRYMIVLAPLITCPPAGAQNFSGGFLLAPVQSATSADLIEAERPDRRIAALVEALQARSPVKDQFETTEQYERRRRSLQTAELMNGVKMTSEIALPFHIRANVLEYDADDGSFLVARRLSFLNGTFLSIIGNSGSISVPTPRSAHDSSFEGSWRHNFIEVFSRDATFDASGINAFGARAPMKNGVLERWGVTDGTPPHRGYGGGPAYDHSGFPKIRVPLSEARLASGSMIGMIIGRIGTPSFFHESNRHFATISDPRNYEEITWVINLTVLRFWIIRADNGKVLAKLAGSRLGPSTEQDRLGDQCRAIELLPYQERARARSAISYRCY